MNVSPQTADVPEIAACPLAVVRRGSMLAFTNGEL